ncbi:ABC transporter ATP-binding protein [Celeribacter neptunius]|uniref:Peptide/nickel transport system ATP-binding protein n=1 Tax=Celeribacter neptunius TaxID=588602 RepID=A0A1I3NR72_9RHOB|nr:ABC transporter ATP-binding protein [Celeribacter neptunius]SFJ11781.1 peptide/nickel transport system ATP-binding protein [Celeribacter neptunius]
MSLLAVENLAIDVAVGEACHRLVHDASFSVEPGETLAIVGESGSGKSLSALAVMGLLSEGLSVGAGTIRYKGQDITHFDERARNQLRGSEIAMVFQEPMTSLNPVRTIGHQITEGMRLKLGLNRKQATARAIELLEEVGISDPAQRLRQYPHQLSGGMRQRVMIAIALSSKPSLILADEPTTALDVTIQAQILSLTARICRDHGVGLVLITHNLGIVARYAQKVAVMYGGRIVEAGTAAALYAAPMHHYTRGLLSSVPRLDTPRDLPLRPIAGAPPDPMQHVPGCRFHPRCAAATAACAQEVPKMEQRAGHEVACWNPVPADQTISEELA